MYIYYSATIKKDQIVSSDKCINCSGPGAELIEHGDSEICACDVEKSNSILINDKCELCSAEHVALRVIESTNLPVYDCIPCHGPTAIIPCFTGL